MSTLGHAANFAMINFAFWGMELCTSTMLHTVTSSAISLGNLHANYSNFKKDQSFPAGQLTPFANGLHVWADITTNSHCRRYC